MEKKSMVELEFNMWFVYIVICSDSTFYTGITNNLEKRISTHNSGNKQSAKYTRSRLPVKLVYSKEYPDKSSAAKEEYRIKQLSRDEKMKLIS